MAMTAKADRPLSVNEAADILGMHPETLRRAIRRGALRATRVGPRAFRIAPADLDAYAGQAMAPPAPSEAQPAQPRVAALDFREAFFETFRSLLLPYGLEAERFPLEEPSQLVARLAAYRPVALFGFLPLPRGLTPARLRALLAEAKLAAAPLLLFSEAPPAERPRVEGLRLLKLPFEIGEILAVARELGQAVSDALPREAGR
jgi:excisionase family DNA binding protein